jgi:2-haloacid dehalogenase
MPHGAYVFDAYGTLFDVHSAVRRCAAVIGPEGQRVSEIWRAKQLEYSWVRALMRRYRDFWALTVEALDYAIAVAAPDKVALKPALLEAYRDIDAYPDVRPALERLKNKCALIVILSNGSPDMLAAATVSAGIEDLLDAVISADQIRSYKTEPRVYALVTEHHHSEPSWISFYSSNRWDIAGATAHGFRTIWINRAAQPDEYHDLPPTAVVRSLNELDKQVLSR